MRCFPQLSSGALAQYPIEKRRLTRTLVNVLPGGDRFKMADPDAAATEWTVDFQTLSDQERSALEKQNAERSRQEYADPSPCQGPGAGVRRVGPCPRVLAQQ